MTKPKGSLVDPFADQILEFNGAAFSFVVFFSKLAC
jgi:hypothetical protein